MTPEKRSAQVVSVPDEAKAKALAATWKGGADWAAMQKAAQDAGGSAIALDDATEQEFPDPELAEACSPPRRIRCPDPVKGALGWHVVRVTSVTPGSDADLRRGEGGAARPVLAGKAADLMYDRANKVDDLLGSGTRLDELPSDLGLAGVAGTLDAEGNTADGTPAPIPGPAELRTRADQGRVRDAEGRPAAADRGADAVNRRFGVLRAERGGRDSAGGEAVRRGEGPGDGRLDARRERHAQEQAAAKLLAAVKGGQSLADAATVAGVTVRRTPLVTRDGGGRGHAAAAGQAAVRPEAGRADDGGDADELHRRRAGRDRRGRPEGRPGRLRPGCATARRHAPIGEATLASPCSSPMALRERGASPTQSIQSWPRSDDGHQVSNAHRHAMNVAVPPGLRRLPRRL